MGSGTNDVDPWETAAVRYRLGDVVRAKVVRLSRFGIFVELEPGIEGLVHISELTDRPIAGPEEVVGVGDEMSLKVLQVDALQRRIGLSRKRV